MKVNCRRTFSTRGDARSFSRLASCQRLWVQSKLHITGRGSHTTCGCMFTSESKRPHSLRQTLGYIISDASIRPRHIFQYLTI